LLYKFILLKAFEHKKTANKQEAYSL